MPVSGEQDEDHQIFDLGLNYPYFFSSSDLAQGEVISMSLYYEGIRWPVRSSRYCGGADHFRARIGPPTRSPPINSPDEVQPAMGWREGGMTRGLGRNRW